MLLNTPMARPPCHPHTLWNSTNVRWQGGGTRGACTRVLGLFESGRLHKVAPNRITQNPHWSRKVVPVTQPHISAAVLVDAVHPAGRTGQTSHRSFRGRRPCIGRGSHVVRSEMEGHRGSTARSNEWREMESSHCVLLGMLSLPDDSRGFAVRAFVFSAVV